MSSNTLYTKKEGKLRVLLATTNKKKIQQYKEVLGVMYPDKQYRPFKLYTLSSTKFLKSIPPPEETTVSTAVNAALKAEYYAKHTGMITICDDGAFYVDGLGGDPGLRAHRDGCEPSDILVALKRANERYMKRYHVPVNRRAHYETTVACCVPEFNYKVGPLDFRLMSDTQNLTGTIIEPNWSSDMKYPVYVCEKDCYGYDAIFRPDGIDSRFGPGYSGTVDGLLHCGCRPLSRLKIGYPRSTAFMNVFQYLINSTFPF